MFWRQRLFLKLNVHVDVNVSTNLSVAHVKIQPPPSAAATDDAAHASHATHATDAANTDNAANAACSPYLQMTSITKQRKKPIRKISLILIMNLLFLLLLSLCCDVCKSNEFPPFVAEIDGDDADDHTNVSNVVASEIDQLKISSIFRNNFFDSNESDLNNATAHEGIKQSCLDNCKSEGNLFLNEFDVKCPDEKLNICYQSGCSKGCEHWWAASKESESCREICFSKEFYSLDLPCISACEEAKRRYGRLQQQHLAALLSTTVPVLKSDNSSGDALTIQWSPAISESYLMNHSFQIQYQYVFEKETNKEIGNPNASDWFNLPNYFCAEYFECEISEGLMPHTGYRFRFKVSLQGNFNTILYSTPTQIYKTKPNGAPISKPVLKDVFAMDGSHIAVFWESGQFTNGPLEGYEIILQNGNLTLNQTLPFHSHEYIFDHLLPSMDYTIRINMFNQKGQGPYAEYNISTSAQKESLDLFDDLKYIILSDQHSIKLKNLNSINETRVIFNSSASIRDFALDILDHQIFIAAGDNIYSIFLDLTSSNQTIERSYSNLELIPQRISIDWLNQMMYIAGKGKDNLWQIAASPVHNFSISILIDHIPEVIDQLLIDPTNGWLFWTQPSGLFSLDLSKNSTHTLLKSNEIGFITNNAERYLLIAFNTSNNALFEISYDGSYVKYLNISPNFQGRPQSLVYYDKSILAINSTHLIRDDFIHKEYDALPLGDMEHFQKVIPLFQKHKLQSRPVPQRKPQALQALLTSKRAKINWRPPELTPFQTEYAWRNWEYELEIMDVDSSNAFNIRNIKTTYFTVDKLQPNNLYRIRVRAVSATGIGDWSDEIVTRTWPMGEYKLIWATTEGLYVTNEIGEQKRQIQEIGNISKFIQLNGTIYYITPDKHLLCKNFMNPEINCSFQATNAIDLAYDWRAGKLYWIDELRNCVIRADLDGKNRELLDIFDAHLIQIDTYSGFIYYMNSRRIAKRALSGSLETELEIFAMSEVEGMIHGFILDLPRQHIYWELLMNNGLNRLFVKDLKTEKEPVELKIPKLEQTIHFGSLQFLPEVDSLLWWGKNRKAITFYSLKGNDITSIDIEGSSKINFVLLKTEYTPYIDESVFPDPIEKDSIRISEGYWDDFKIIWDPISTAINYTIFYKILLQSNDQIYLKEVNETALRVTEFDQPSQLLNLSITAHTYWAVSKAVHIELRTPAAVASQPERLRVFMQHVEQPLQTQPNLTAVVRWDSPKDLNEGVEIFYKVYCWLNGEILAEHTHNASFGSPLETTMPNLVYNKIYKFQVQAFTAGGLNGGGKTPILALNTTREDLSLPRVLVSTNDAITEFDLDNNRSHILVQTTSEVEHLAIMQGERRILWVNQNVELISLTPGSKPIKLARMRAEVTALTVDWISRIVYWAEKDSYMENTVSIYKLDLCQYEGRVMTGSKIFSLENNTTLKDLVVYPYSQALIWLEHDMNEDIMALKGYNISESKMTHFQNSLMSMIRIFGGSLAPDSESVVLLDPKNKMCIYDIHNHVCQTIKNQFVSDTDQIIDIDGDETYIYYLNQSSIHAYNNRKHLLEHSTNVDQLKLIKAYNYQPYPPQRCLLPMEDNGTIFKPTVKSLGSTFIVLDFPSLNITKGCWLEYPGIKYILLISDEKDMSHNLSTFEKFINITHLQPFTSYKINLNISTFYQQKLQLPPLQSKEFMIRTAVGTPWLPRNFTAWTSSPSEISVYWVDPLIWNFDSVWYQLHWQMENSNLGMHKTLNETFTTLRNLEPYQKYRIWLKVFSIDSNFNTTPAITVQTFDKPSPILLTKASASDLTVSWTMTPNVTKAVLVCQDLSRGDEIYIDITKNPTNVTVSNLMPKSKYLFHLQLTYVTSKSDYVWPELVHDRFLYETLGDAPSSPGRPQVEHIAGEIFKVFWDPAQDNGAPIIEYSLEALKARKTRRIRRKTNLEHLEPSYDAKDSVSLLNQMPWAEEPQLNEDKWIIYYNTSELSCIVQDLHTLRLLKFRVRARNEPYGWGPYSLDSETVSEPFVSPEKRNSLILAIIIPATIVSSCVIILVLIRMVYLRRKSATKIIQKSRPSIWSDISMSQQQNLMSYRNRAFSTTSTLYKTTALSDADIALLPHIDWDQISLLEFLGSGAFGEVYEGLLKYDHIEEPQKVAIKTLRKGASEFTELIQEAQLMSNFKHENIVELIGICCNAESISIIMEYMEGGDLLSYLRDCRPIATKPLAILDVSDLLAMCIDVASGCCYLEDMHYVHRDLACRNCLVSSLLPGERTVKIGDFGLARDIYKNDYYRKEGEGLLPVRWMSPESLIDGVFTTQSDVWAFGVLCWEILTLGQQPYIARNNFEVLAFVKEGGRLEKPSNCPDALYSLLMQCWSANPDDRPCFGDCLSVLLAVKTEVHRKKEEPSIAAEDIVYANDKKLVLSNQPDNKEKIKEEVTESKTEQFALCFGNNSNNGDIGHGSEGFQLTEGDRTEKSLNKYFDEGISRL